MAAKKKVTKKAAPKPPKAAKPRLADIAAPPQEEWGGEGQQIPSLPVAVAPQTAPMELGVAKDIQTRNREFAAAMNRDGRKLVVSADDAPNVYELRRPTGIMPLDIDIGGGFPAGGLSIISGPDNTGKSWLAMKTIAMNQKLRGPKSNVAYAYVEGAFDFKRAMQVGVTVPIPDEIINEWNQERVNLSLPGYTPEDVKWFKRQVGGLQIIRGSTGEEIMHIVLEAVKANIYDIIIVDSLSVLLPEADEDKDVGDTPKRAGNANLMTDFIRKYTPYTSGLTESNPTTLIGIMQVRANAERANAQPHIQKYLKEWAVTGAYATRHGKLVDLTIWDGSPIKKTVHGQVTVVGKPLYWRTEKGKAGTHDNITGETEFRYDIPGGHDDIGSLILSGIARGVFVENGKRIEIYHPVTKEKTNLGGYSGFPALRKVIEEDFDFEHQMRLFILASFGVQCLYRPLA